MGFEPEMLSERRKTCDRGIYRGSTRSLSGSGAYQVRPDVAANNQRLLEYRETAAGTLIVQYQLAGVRPAKPDAVSGSDGALAWQMKTQQSKS